MKRDDVRATYLDVGVDGEILPSDDRDPTDGVIVEVLTAAQDGAPLAGPLSWLNSARIYADTSGDRVTLSVSVADPRGGFSLTVERMDDGTLRLSVPHPEDTYLHAPLAPLASPGYYEIEGDFSDVAAVCECCGEAWDAEDMDSEGECPECTMEGDRQVLW